MHSAILLAGFWVKLSGDVRSLTEPPNIYAKEVLILLKNLEEYANIELCCATQVRGKYNHKSEEVFHF